MTQIITQTNPAIKRKECRFAVYIPPPEYGMPDLHLVKENIEYEDGTTKPAVTLIKDFKRNFFTTKKGFQNHKDKKEWEDKEKLIEWKTTQSKLVENAAKALGQSWYKGSLRKLATSPFLYGADIASTAVIKKAYQDRYPGVQSKYSVAVFDVETDVLNGTDEVIMASITYKDTVYTAVVKSFVTGVADVVNRVEEMLQKYLGDVVKARNIKSEVVLVDSAIQAIALCFQKAHELKPDFLAIWNMDFDVSKIIAACEKARVDPAIIFSDPCVPKEYRYFKYNQGPKMKVTASGLQTPIKPAAQWHTVICPASFYVIDAMCVFKHNRIGKPEKQSYSLDYILNDTLGIRKLKFTQADAYTGLKWHKIMQASYKLEYIVYNMFDCISIEILDEKTLDLSLTLPLFAGFSDFSNYNSQPRRTVDTLHYYCLSNNRVIGTTGSNMSTDENDDFDLRGWIVTLPAHLVMDNGLKVIEENPNLTTNIRIHVGDLDVSAAYPNNQCVFNISKETTKKEIMSIEGVQPYTQKMQGINLSAGHTNAVEWCQTLLGFPSLNSLLEDFETTLRV